MSRLTFSYVGPEGDSLMDMLVPRKKTAHAAGFDLFAAEACEISPNRRALIRTGWVAEFPPGKYGLVTSTSGLAWQKGVIVITGVIDEDYTGEMAVHLHNTSDSWPTRINLGQKIGQLLILEYSTDLPFIRHGATVKLYSQRKEAGFGCDNTADMFHARRLTNQQANAACRASPTSPGYAPSEPSPGYQLFDQPAEQSREDQNLSERREETCTCAICPTASQAAGSSAASAPGRGRNQAN